MSDRWEVIPTLVAIIVVAVAGLIFQASDERDRLRRHEAARRAMCGDVHLRLAVAVEIQRRWYPGAPAQVYSEDDRVIVREQLVEVAAQAASCIKTPAAVRRALDDLARGQLADPVALEAVSALEIEMAAADAKGWPLTP